MTNRIIVNDIPEETRMALIEDGELTEFVVERSDNSQLVGNIYKGKIKNVLPGMQAAFVDIGREKNAFLYIGDMFIQNDAAADDIATAGQDILIQIGKDAVGTKGPRATTHLTLPGRYVVLMPTVDYIGISRRIHDDAERERLKELAERVKPDGMGLIVRTVAAGRSFDDLQKDIRLLVNLWNALTARTKIVHAPALLYRDVDLIIRIVRDYLTDDMEQLIIDSREAYARIEDLLQYIAPELQDRVKLYTGQEDIFAHLGLEAEIEALAQRQVWLKCGGYLVFDHTEALTVIDVNTGKFVGNTSLANTVLQTNLEAAAEIARQLRLRDIGGIIIIDFIDMTTEAHKQAVLQALTEELNKDRTKSNVLGLTALGLVEMTRKKSRQSVENMLYLECPYCHGTGHIQSPQTIAIRVRRELRRVAVHAKAGNLKVQVHPMVAEVLSLKGGVERMENRLARRIVIEPVATMHPEAFSILGGKE